MAGPDEITTISRDAVMRPTAAAALLPIRYKDALAWVRESACVRVLAGRDVVVWGDVIDRIREGGIYSSGNRTLEIRGGDPEWIPWADVTQPGFVRIHVEQFRLKDAPDARRGISWAGRLSRQDGGWLLENRLRTEIPADGMISSGRVAFVAYLNLLPDSLRLVPPCDPPKVEDLPEVAS